MKIRLSKLKSLIRETLEEQGEKAGAVFGMPLIDDDDEDGMGPPDVAGSDRAEMVDEIASEIVDAMDSSSLSEESFDELVDDMIDQGKLDGDMYLSSDIDYSEIKDRVVEIEEDLGFEGGNTENRFMEKVGEALSVAGEGGLDADDVIYLVVDSLIDDMYGTGFDREDVIRAMSAYIRSYDSKQ